MEKYTLEQVHSLCSIASTAVVCMLKNCNPSEVAVLALSKMRDENLPTEFIPIVLGTIGAITDIEDLTKNL